MSCCSIRSDSAPRRSNPVQKFGWCWRLLSPWDSLPYFTNQRSESNQYWWLHTKTKGDLFHSLQKSLQKSVQTWGNRGSWSILANSKTLAFLCRGAGLELSFEDLVRPFQLILKAHPYDKFSSSKLHIATNSLINY